MPQPLALTSDPEMEQLGGPLHPVLRRYIAGDQPLPLSILKEVTPPSIYAHDAIFIYAISAPFTL